MDRLANIARTLEEAKRVVKRRAVPRPSRGRTRPRASAKAVGNVFSKTRAASEMRRVQQALAKIRDNMSKLHQAVDAGKVKGEPEKKLAVLVGTARRFLDWVEGVRDRFENIVRVIRRRALQGEDADLQERGRRRLAGPERYRVDDPKARFDLEERLEDFVDEIEEVHWWTNDILGAIKDFSVTPGEEKEMLGIATRTVKKTADFFTATERAMNVLRTGR